MNNVNHSSRRGLVRSFQGSERMWRRESYTKLAEEWGEAKFLFLLIRMCGVGLEYQVISLGQKSL